MPGNATNGLPTVSAPTLNGVAQTPPNGTYTQLSSTLALVAVDTETAAGQSPQTVAASMFQVASALAGVLSNTATSTVAAATLNTTGGTITTEALTTAAGATYTFTLTNSLLTTSVAAPQVAIRSKSNTGGTMQVTSVTNGSGTCVIVFTNIGTSALNGTMIIVFHV